MELQLFDTAPAARYAYDARLIKPGKNVVWTVRVSDAYSYQRNGVIWSEGPTASSWWVTPDEHHEADTDIIFLVYRAGRRHALYAEGELYQADTDWRASFYRAESIREQGVYVTASADGQLTMHTGPLCEDTLDRDVPDWATHTDREGSELYWTAWDVADVLIGRVPMPDGMPRFCTRCMLEEG